MAAPVQFAALAAEHRVPFAGLSAEFLALLDTPEGKAAVAGGRGFSPGLKLLKHVRPLMMKLLTEEWRAVRRFQPDVLVYHPQSLASPDMAEALGVPHVLASPIPGFTPTDAFPVQCSRLPIIKEPPYWQVLTWSEWSMRLGKTYAPRLPGPAAGGRRPSCSRSDVVELGDRHRQGHQ